MSKITKFKTGAIRDTQEGKIDFTETIAWESFGRYAAYMTEKAKKYGKGNFLKGIPIESYEKSMLRHVHKYMVNKQGGDLERDQDHLAAIVFNVFGIMLEEERNKRNEKRS